MTSTDEFQKLLVGMLSTDPGTKLISAGNAAASYCELFDAWENLRNELDATQQALKQKEQQFKVMEEHFDKQRLALLNARQELRVYMEGQRAAGQELKVAVSMVPARDYTELQQRYIQLSNRFKMLADSVRAMADA